MKQFELRKKRSFSESGIVNFCVTGDEETDRLFASEDFFASHVPNSSNRSSSFHLFSRKLPSMKKREEMNKRGSWIVFSHAEALLSRVWTYASPE